ncbi:ABC transporter domain-containing protein [Ditylenchus destructor]|nr:ABC transporter domain-containing protein [Ditylenchus destructor]
MLFFDTTPLGRILNRFGKDIEVVDSVLTMNFRHFAICIMQVVATLAVICITTPVFVFAIIPLAMIYYMSLKFYVPTSRQLKRLESINRSPIYSHFGETIQGSSSIRAFGKTEEFCLDSENRVDKFLRIKYLSLVSNRWLAVRLEFVGNAVILFAALFAALSNEMGLLQSAGLVGLSVSYALNITEVLNAAVRQVSELETNIVSVERLKEYSEVETEADWKIEGKEPPKGWPNAGSLVFENYSTRYRPGLELVVKNINAEIYPAEKVGIVGRTGAGKSSLTLALFRMIEPVEGKIIIDGVDISEIGLHDLRSNLTIIPQDPVLFSGTLRFNLDPFSKHSDVEIWKVLELAHLKTFVSSLPESLDHAISEGGDNISLGQKQLVCLARALLRRTKILVLDEATAAIDIYTDSLIQETIRREFQESTVFTIAHRLNTIIDYNRVIVLQKGQIMEFDSPQKLLSADSMFSKMAQDAKLQEKE